MTGFAGLERDTVTGLNLAVFRVQNPGTGRWTSEDPLSFAAGDANLYRYTDNGPSEEADRAGLQGPPQNGGGVFVLGGLPPFKGYPSPYDWQVITSSLSMQLVMSDTHCRAEGSPPERGRVVLWNPGTGQIGVTVGNGQAGRHHVELPDPGIPGWQKIGTIHTHYGNYTTKVCRSHGDLYWPPDNPGPLYYGCAFNMYYYIPYQKGQEVIDPESGIIVPGVPRKEFNPRWPKRWLPPGVASPSRRPPLAHC